MPSICGVRHFLILRNDVHVDGMSQVVAPRLSPALCGFRACGAPSQKVNVGNGNAEVEKSFKDVTSNSLLCAEGGFEHGAVLLSSDCRNPCRLQESEPVVIAVADADLSKQFEAKPVVDLHVPTTESASRSAMESCSRKGWAL